MELQWSTTNVWVCVDVTTCLDAKLYRFEHQILFGWASSHIPVSIPWLQWGEKTKKNHVYHPLLVKGKLHPACGYSCPRDLPELWRRSHTPWSKGAANSQARQTHQSTLTLKVNITGLPISRVVFMADSPVTFPLKDVREFWGTLRRRDKKKHCEVGRHDWHVLEVDKNSALTFMTTIIQDDTDAWSFRLLDICMLSCTIA